MCGRDAGRHKGSQPGYDERSDRGGDRNGRAGDQSPIRAFEPEPGHEYARSYPDPFTGEPLQIHPPRTSDEFESSDDFFTYLDAVSRYMNGLPPPPWRLPGGEELGEAVPPATTPTGRRERALRTKHVGIRISQRDFELLDALADERGVPPGTMARMLVIRALRAVAD